MKTYDIIFIVTILCVFLRVSAPMSECQNNVVGCTHSIGADKQKWAISWKILVCLHKSVLKQLPFYLQLLPMLGVCMFLCVQ